MSGKIELSFDYIDGKHVPTIKILLDPCGPDDSQAWDARDLLGKRMKELLAVQVVERQPVAVSDEQLQSLADEAFRKWEKTGNPVSGVNGYMAAKAGFREGAVWAACAELSLDKVKELNQ